MRERTMLPGLLCDEAVWDDLVDRLAVYDVTYLTGGSAEHGRQSRYRGPNDVEIHSLVADLAQAPEPRLRDALIALLLRHPEQTSAVCTVIAKLPPDDPARRELVVRLLAAAALQRVWGFVLPLYLPGQPRIMVDDLVASLGLPRPEEEGGEALLDAAARTLAGPYPFDWKSGWEDAADQLLTQLRLAAIPRPVAVG